MATLTEQLSEIRFDIAENELTTSKLARIKLNCNSYLNSADEALKKLSTKIAGGDVTSFVLDEIIQRRAHITVYSQIANVIWNASKKVADDDVIDHIVKTATRHAIMRFKINSCSNVSVEMELAEKLVWGQFVSELDLL